MIGETLGSYRIVGRVGTGGMGEVYLAQHTRIDRRAAIKVLLPELSHNQDVVDRFFAEARATSSIHHAGIVEVLDCDVHASGRAYIVMELLEGESLAGRLARDGAFGRDVGRVLDVTAAVADAVAAAHAKGIVHRDLKPDNIFLANDARAASGFVVKILDFGIAKLMGGDGDGGRGASMRTRTGSLLGTPAYMSPEQCRGASRVDHRTDIYSLGCIAFEMLAGRRPFTYEGFGELISAHLTLPPPSLARLGVKVAPAIEQWIQRLLAKSPDDRFGSMRELVTSIDGLRGVVPAAPSSSLASAGGTAVLPVYDEPAAPAASAAPGPARGPVTATAVLPSSPPPTTTTTLSQNAAERLPRHPRTRARWVWVAGATGLLAAAGVGALLVRPHPKATTTTTATATAATTPPSPIAARPAAAPSRPSAPRLVTIEVDDAPVGLTATLDGSPVELPIRVPAGDEMHALVFHAPGYQERTLRMPAAESRHLTLALQPAAAAPPPSPAAHERTDDRHRRARPVPAVHPGELTEDARKL